MTTTYTDNLRLALQGVGDNPTTWGIVANTQVFELLEDAITGYTTLSVTGGPSDITLSTSNGAPDQARSAIIELSGLPTSNRNVIAPTVTKVYVLHATFTGSNSITFKTASGSGVTLVSGDKKIVFCNGIDIIDLSQNLGSLAFLNTITSAGLFSASVVNTSALQDDSVTNLKLSEMDPNTVKVNNTAGTANPVDVSVGTNQVLARGSGNITPHTVTKGLSLSSNNLLVNLKSFHAYDEKPQNTNAGTFTAGSWQTRTLNTVGTNTITSAGLAANRVTLPAGTYLVYATAPSVRVGANALRLQNITAGTTLLSGVNAFAVDAGGGTSGQQPAILLGQITLSVTSELELQHQCQLTAAAFGLGAALNFTGRPEIYASIIFVEIN